MPPRKCSRDDCPPQNVSKELLVQCHRCKCQIHLPCYGIDKAPAEVFPVVNIVILCDECLANDYVPSPKRKNSMVQRTLESNLTLTTPHTESPSNKNDKTAAVKASTQKMVESLTREVKMQTATIAALKTSVDSMHGTVSQRYGKDQKSVDQNNEKMSMITKQLAETHNLISSIKKPSYAEAAKRAFRQQTETPRSSRTPKTNVPNLTTAPVQAGKSTKVIGKALSPKPTPRQKRNFAEKAIWLSKLHRETTAEEVLSYIRDDLGINVDQLEVRKLVKKGRDIREYTFVSFCINCPSSLFDTLMDVNKWPDYSQIREFVISPNQTPGVRKNDKSSSKNDNSLPANRTPPHQAQMDTV